MNTLHPLSILGGSLGAGELMVIFLAILLLFGSKNLPKIARSLGRALAELRRAARDFSGEIARADWQPFDPDDKLGDHEGPSAKEPREREG
ncbi:MAG: twin arginine translocase protein A [Verrucomicrobia bacterium ADurb.Bin345]|nr:MAG: twin arginine translocase protein A [Verrucomicrobia bacterium ADurb.Bin345]